MRLVNNKPTGRPDHKRVPCICTRRSAWIVYKGVRIGKLTEEGNDACETDWVIEVFWDIWDKMGQPDIPGVDTELRLKEYIRQYVPIIVEQRTFSDEYEDLQNELRRFGLTWNDRFEVMCRNHGRCGNNDLLIERCEDNEVEENLCRVEGNSIFGEHGCLL